MRNWKPEEDKQELNRYLNHTHTEKLRGMIEESLKELDSIEVSDFTNPNWSNAQAFYLGQRKVLRDLKRILEKK